MLEGLLIVAAYVVGSIPTGVIVGRIRGFDPRAVGSGNIGASNVAGGGGAPCPGGWGGGPRGLSPPPRRVVANVCRLVGHQPVEHRRDPSGAAPGGIRYAIALFTRAVDATHREVYALWPMKS
jgi:hypothetical protein